MAAFGVLSHRQLDASIFGYPEKRTRAEGGALARPKRIKSFGQTAVLYPEFGLAGLVIDRPSEPEKRLLAHVDETAQRLYRTAAFLAFGDRVRRELRKDWAFDTIIARITAGSASILVDLQGDIREAERALRREGVEIESVIGRLHAITEGVFVIRLPDTAGVREIRSLPVNSLAASLAPGAWVIREIVRLGSRSGELIVPSFSPETLPEALRARERADVLDELPQSSEESFNKLDYVPLHLPHLVADDERDARDGVLPVTVSPAAMAMSFDAASYLSANSMARPASSATA